MAITAITSVQEFDEKVLGSKGLAIVDFWAAWCEPCTVMRPEVEAVAERLKGQVEFFSNKFDTAPSSTRRQCILYFTTRFINFYFYP